MNNITSEPNEPSSLPPTFQPSNSRTAMLKFFIGLLVAALINIFLTDLVLALLEISGAIILIVAPVQIFGLSIGFYSLIVIFAELFVISLIVRPILERLSKIQWRRSLTFVVIFVVLSATYFGSHLLVQTLIEVAALKQNSIETATVHYDFSQAALIRDSKTSIMNPKIQGDKVIWVEQTREFPTFAYNEWDVMQFGFSPARSTGTLSQLSDFSVARNRSPGGLAPLPPVILGGKVYWAQDDSIYDYNQTTKKPEIVTGDYNRVFSGYNNHLLVAKTPTQTGPTYFLLDLDTKKSQPLNIQPYNGYPLEQGQYLCYISGQNLRPDKTASAIERFDVTTGQAIQLSVPEGSQNGDNLVLTDCGGDYMTYYTGGVNGQFVIYQVSAKKIVFTKKINFSNPNRTNAEIRGSVLLYADKFGIHAASLNNGTDKILTTTKVRDWDADENYLVYSTGQQIYLQSIDTQGQLKQIAPTNTDLGTVVPGPAEQGPNSGSIRNETYYPPGDSVGSDITIVTLGSPEAARAYLKQITNNPLLGYTATIDIVAQSGNNVQITNCPCSNPSVRNFFRAAWVSNNLVVEVSGSRDYDNSAKNAVDAYLVKYPSSLTGN